MKPGRVTDDVLERVVAQLRAAGCVFAEDEATLLVDAAVDAGQLDAARLAALVARRVAGEPLEPLLGWASFFGLRILIEPGVFVPRRRTELMVREAAALLADGGALLDLCCGAGPIVAAVLSARPVTEAYAADVDPTAVMCARRNVQAAGGAASHVYEGDLFEPVPAALQRRIAVLCVNAPYVPTDEIAFMPAEARDHEARIALDGGSDGLEVHRRIAADVRQWLAPGGSWLIETSRRQVPQARAMMDGAGLTPRVVRDDSIDATVVAGRLSA